MADIGESIFGAVTVIVDRKLSDLRFDKTITGLIESVDGIAEEGKENKYIVNDGITKYVAYSNNVYRENTSVYVSIPNGDYQQKKFIIGYNLGEKETDTVYTVNDEFINITGSISSSELENKTFELLANGVTKTTEPISIDNLNIGGYSSMMINAIFETQLGSVSLTEGDYGLKCLIKGKDKQGVDIEGIANFSSAQMFGDIYNFEGGYSQSYLFSVEDFSVVNSIEVLFFQGLESEFIQENGKKLPSNIDGIEYSPNLFAKNVNISFGYRQKEILGENNLFIFSDEKGNVYYSDDYSKNTNGKIFARWIKRNKDGSIVSFNNIPSEEELTGFGFKDFKIEWYVENINKTTPNAESAILKDLKWEPLKDTADDFVLEYYPAGSASLIDLKKNNNKIIAVIQYLNDALFNEKLPESLKDRDVNDFDKEELATYTTYKNLYTVTIKSQALIYTNMSSSTAESAIERATGITLIHNNPLDKFKGVYNIYRDGKLINQGDKAIPRTVIPQFKKNTTTLKTGDIVTWRVPSINSHFTMIDIVLAENETFSEENNYMIITKQVDGELSEDSYQLIYKIKPDYKALRDTQNTIYCQVTSSGEKYDEVSVDLQFGNTGTIGTEYGIEISLTNENGQLIYAMPTQEDKIWLEAKVISTSGAIIEPTGWSFKFIQKPEELSILDGEASNKKILSWAGTGTRQCKTSVLEIKCKAEGNNLVEYFPIASCHDSAVLSINGLDKIRYNSNGIIEYYYPDEYTVVPAPAETPNYKYIYNDTAIDKLKPDQLYNMSSPQVSCLEIYNNNKLLWSQPIYIYQDKWSSSIINQWNEDLTMDEKNDTILSAMMAAGTKDNNNAFTGVVMGKVKLDKNKPAENGLFGFKEGSETFGFKSDGTGFIGSSGGARIEFDGTKGFIQNANFKPVTANGQEVGATEGLKIDFVNAKILSPSFQLTQESGTTATAGTIAGWNFNNEQLSAQNTVFLYSQDQFKKNNKGEYEKDDAGNKVPENIKIGSSNEINTWRIRVGNQFGVTSGGIVYGNLANLTGVNADTQTQLDSLSNDHSLILTKINAAEDLITYTLDNSVIQTNLYKELRTNGSNNNPTILGRIVNLENSLGTRPGNVSNNIYQRIANLEDIVKEENWKQITYITGFTTQTETITITDEYGIPKSITVITGITPSTTTETVLVKNTQ